MAAEPPIAQPLGGAESEEHKAKRETGKRNDDGEPSGIGVGTLTSDAAEDGGSKERGQCTGNKHAEAGAQQGAGAIVGLIEMRGSYRHCAIQRPRPA